MKFSGILIKVSRAKNKQQQAHGQFDSSMLVSYEIGCYSPRVRPQDFELGMKITDVVLQPLLL